MSLPRIGITLGDVAGIGPEVVVRTLRDLELAEHYRPVVFGPAALLSRVADQLGADLEVHELASWEELADYDWQRGVPCWNPAGPDVLKIQPGGHDGRAGRAAYTWLVSATHAALRGEIEAITTAPLSKAALHAAGLHYPGHTEILAEECGVQDFGMMLYLPPGGRLGGEHGLGVVHVTLHTSIRSVPDLLSPTAVSEKIGLMDRFLKRIGCAVPRVGVCALNPHAGEEGLFGDEEQRVIIPGVMLAREAGIHAVGPLPADTLLKRAVAGEFDGVVAMYHDQGHIALKLIGFDSAANITLGLPIIRTSPSHGTAFDIAHTYQANPTGFRQALLIAVQLAGGGKL